MFQIEQFTRQALREAARQINAGNSKEPKASVLAVVTGGTAGAREGLMSLRILRQKGYRITLVASAAAQEIWGRDFLAGQSEAHRVIWDNRPGLADELVKSHSRLVIPVLTSNSAAKIASARWDTLPTYLVYQALMGGLEVLAAKDAALPKLSANGVANPQVNPVLAGMLENNLRLLAEMGIKITEAVRLAECIPEPAGQCLPEPAGDIAVKGAQAGDSRPGDTVSLNKKVVSQSDLVPLARQGRTVILGKGTLITPLARDYAAGTGLTLRIEE